MAGIRTCPEPQSTAARSSLPCCEALISPFRFSCPSHAAPWRGDNEWIPKPGSRRPRRPSWRRSLSRSLALWGFSVSRRGMGGVLLGPIPPKSPCRSRPRCPARCWRTLPSSSLEFDTYLSGASVSGAPGNLSFSIGVALEVPAGGTTSISWDFSKLDSVKNADILAEAVAGCAPGPVPSGDEGDDVPEDDAAAGERDAGADGPREIPTA